MNFVPVFSTKFNLDSFTKQFDTSIDMVEKSVMAQAEIEAQQLSDDISQMIAMKRKKHSGRLESAFRPFAVRTGDSISFGVDVNTKDVNYVETQTQLTKEEGPNKTIYGKTRMLTIPLTPNMYGMRASEGDYAAVKIGGSVFLTARGSGVLSFVLKAAATHKNRVPIYQLADRFKEHMPKVMNDTARDAFMKGIKR